MSIHLHKNQIKHLVLWLQALVTFRGKYVFVALAKLKRYSHFYFVSQPDSHLLFTSVFQPHLFLMQLQYISACQASGLQRCLSPCSICAHKLYIYSLTQQLQWELSQSSTCYTERVVVFLSTRQKNRFLMKCCCCGVVGRSVILQVKRSSLKILFAIKY